MPRLLKLFIALVISAIILSSCAQGSREKDAQLGEDKGRVIATSFYPIYLHTANIAKDIPNVKVINLTKPQTGCLHDYQFTTDDLKTLEGADIFVINGGGMEAFMDKVTGQIPNLKIVEASRGMELLKYREGGSSEEYNPHVWVSISGAMDEVRNISIQLEDIDPENAESYRANADKYLKKLDELKGKMHEVLDNIKNRDIITFHEAFPYFAREFNLNVVDVIEREPGSQPSAGELAETIDIVRKHNVKALFAEPQYSQKAADTIASETGAKVYTLDPVVTGPDDADAYINIMENNLKVLQEALK